MNHSKWQICFSLLIILLSTQARGAFVAPATIVKSSKTVPIVSLYLNNVVKVSSGTWHSCAVLSDGTIKCWGNGYLGAGSYSGSNTPVTVTGITTANSVEAGYDHTCAIVDVLGVDFVKCWGLGTYGQLGDGTNTSSTTPVTVPGIATAESIGVGDYRTRVVLSDGTVRYWGLLDFYTAADGTDTYYSDSTPQTLSGITMADSVDSQNGHSCVVTSARTVQCWGDNSSGQLGDGNTTAYEPESLTPVTVSGIISAENVSAGYYYTCASLIDGTVKCWGNNRYGQLGDGSTTNSPTPITVSGIATANGVSAGCYHTCVALDDGTVECWGFNNHGQLGDGTTTDSSTPVAVSGITTATSVSAGCYYSCALLSGGTVKCWGYNGSGQLGNGTNTDSYTPVRVRN